MSSNQSESDDAVGRREVAWRVFAAEFDDADFSYAESDEERAPNYVVTPTGARVNRIFVVGVLTEVEPVSDDVLRARIVDPTGAFVVYAGQYQPDALAFLESADVPEFVAVTGKARTFQPEDADVVYTSIRPESINAVDAETRDRWTVRTAEQTVERVGTMADALDREERGGDLRDALVAAGVRPDLAAGVPLAIDHYGTTETYLEAVRDLSVEAAEVVAGERAEVAGLDVAPAEGGPVDADLGADLAFDTTTEPEAPEPEPEGTGDTTEVETESAPASEATTEVESEAESEPVESGDAETAEETASSVETETEFEFESESESDATEAEPEPESKSVGDASEPAETAESTDSVESAETAESTESAGTESGTLGDFEPSTAPESDSEESGVEAEADTDEMYELSEEERQEVEEEFDVGFSTGNEVPEAGETDIEPEGTESELDVEESEETVEETAAAFEEAVEGEDESAEEAAAAADLDNLEDAVIDAMQELDEGDGADHDELVATVVERYDVSQDEVADAIQDALMSGRCYESGDDNLKAI